MTRWASLLAAGLFSICTLAHAEDYPSRTVRIVVPYPAGGATDITARAVAQELGKMWKQSVIVENRSGAIGVIGADYVAKSVPDGYTLMLSTQNEVSINQSLSTLPYDPLKAFVPITLGTSSPQVMVINPKLPINSVAEFVAYAKANPGKLSYASPGEGSTQHLGGAFLAKVANIDMLHVPYRGTQPAMTDVIAGHVSAMFGAIGPYLPHIKAGTLRALAVTADKRAETLPDVPTMTEAGIPNFVMINWFGVYAPAGTPDDIVRLLNRDFVKALHSDEVKESMRQQALDIGGNSQADFQKFWVEQIAGFKTVIDAVGLTKK